MKKSTWMKTVSTLILAALLISITGCQPQQTTDAKTKLIVVENRELKQKLQATQTDLTDAKKLLEDCKQEKQAIMDRSNEGTAELLTTVMQDFAKEAQTLKAENTQLKAQIAELNKKLAEQK